GAIGRSVLPKLKLWISKRQKLSKMYNEGLSPLQTKGLINLPKIESGHSCQTYMIVLSERYDRSSVIKSLRGMGIESSLGAQSMSSLNLYKHPNNIAFNFSVGPKLYTNGLALPLHENLTDKDINEVISALNKVLVR